METEKMMKALNNVVSLTDIRAQRLLQAAQAEEADHEQVRQALAEMTDKMLVWYRNLHFFTERMAEDGYGACKYSLGHFTDEFGKEHRAMLFTCDPYVAVYPLFPDTMGLDFSVEPWLITWASPHPAPYPVLGKFAMNGWKEDKQ